MQLKQAEQPQDFGQPPGGPGGDQGEGEDDGGGGDESDDMAAADQDPQQQGGGAQEPEPWPDSGDDAAGGGEQQFGKAEGGGNPNHDPETGRFTSGSARTPQMRMEKRGLHTLYDTTLKNGLAGPEAPLVRITADDLTAIIERGPGVERADGTIIVHGADLKRATGTKRGHGMLKIIWKHGQKSGEPEGYRVAKGDVLAIPEVLRTTPTETNESNTKFEWKRKRFDGKTVVYAASRYGSGDDAHIVTVYVEKPEQMKKSDSFLQGEGFTHLGIPEGALSVVLPTDESLTGYFIHDADSVNEAHYGPITKAIGMPPVIRICLPGVDDEARQ